MLNLFDWRSCRHAETLEPWRPRATTHEQWPPHYARVYAWRIRELELLQSDPDRLSDARAYYKTRPAEFIMHWMDTYNPRKDGNKWLPFVFFKRQNEFITYLHECRQASENALIEKSRDVGLTWLCCAYSVWSWIFVPNDAIGWGSRKQDLVDRPGDLDSIFEKMRKLIERLPPIWVPAGFDPRKHATFCKLINPSNGSVITGEAGDSIGRGGRKSIYLKDEAAHYERPEKIEAALGDNTNVQVDISSVNGVGNVFHRRREAGIDWAPGREFEKGFTRVFVFDWRDHPEKNQAWYDLRKARYDREGMSHIFAQEVDRNYSAAISNTVIPYEWLVDCVDAHVKIGYVARASAGGKLRAGLDVADEGIDRNALCTGEGIIWRTADEWGERDTGATTRRAVEALRGRGLVRLQYDAIGIGSAVKAEYNRLADDGAIDRAALALVPWNAGAGVQWPYARIIPDDESSLTNFDLFANLKAQAWWSMRTRCYKTSQAARNGTVYPIDELISFDGKMPLLHQVLKELSQATKKSNGALKIVIEKSPEGTKSPNLADAGVMMFFPIEESNGPIVGNYGG